MTKWARMRRRKERIRAEEALRESKAEDKEAKLTIPKKITENIQHFQETEKLESPKTFKPNTILAQIPRYVYLVAIFALLSGVFFPLITPGVPFDHLIKGTLTLFLGLAGGILLFKAITLDNRRGILTIIGFALITISLALIYHIRDEFSSIYY